jgi:3-oxoacyl-[acyl-carrier-protein] synthase-1
MTRLAIQSCGLITSGGYCAPASLAAIRAGVRTVERANIWDPETGTYLAAGKVPLPQWSTAPETIADLAASAIVECLLKATPSAPQDVPILLGLAEASRPHRPDQLDDRLLKEVERRIGRPLHPFSRILPDGHVSLAAGIQQAYKIITDEKVRCVIVAAADSLLHPRLTNYYLDERRLLTPVQSNGFCVGEAGSAVLIVPASAAQPGSVEIIGMGLGREEATIGSEKGLRGTGLTEAVRKALETAGITMQQVHYCLSDLNGEHYKFKEMTLALGRFPRRPTPRPMEQWHPIEFVGDVGAAIGPLLVAVALDAWQKHYAVGQNVLCTMGNDSGERAALVLSGIPRGSA